MRLVKFSIYLTLILALASCSSVTIKTDHDPSVDFSKFKTYRWYSGKTPDDALSKDPLLKKRVIAAMDNELQSKGLTLTESEDADLVAVVHAGVKERMQVQNWGSYGWYDPWWGPYGGHTDVSYYTEGTLILDLVDMTDKELAWRGMATKTIDPGASAEKQERNLKEIAMRLLKDFPPK